MLNSNGLFSCFNKGWTDNQTYWITPTFTTTNPKDVTVTQIGLMHAMKHYFSYGFTFSCGLPQVTLLGTRQDWRRLIEKAKYLYSFGNKDLTHWADLLIPVLNQFLALYDEKECLATGRGVFHD